MERFYKRSFLWFDRKHFFIQTSVDHVILCVGGYLLAFTVSTSYNQIFIRAKRVDVKVLLILYFTGDVIEIGSYYPIRRDLFICQPGIHIFSL